MLLPALLILAAQVPQHFSNRVPDLNPTDTARLLTADSAGDLFVVSSSPKTSAITNIHVVKTDPAGAILASFDFGGSGIDTPAAAATDSQGNLIIAGRTTSKDFPLLAPLRNTGEGFVTKIAASLGGILFSTRLGTVGGGPIPDGAAAIALDQTGNIYLAGSTEPGFTTTTGVLQPQAPALPQAGTIEHGFVMEISAVGDRVIFATYLTGANANFVNQTGPHGPMVPVITTTPSAIAVDSNGRVIVAGTTNSNDIPVNATAYATQCQCTSLNLVAFVVRLAPGGTGLDWGTYLPAGTPNLYAPSVQGVPLDTVTALALDSSGNVVFGGTAVPAFPVSTSALQGTFPSHTGNTYAGYLARLDSTGTKLLFATWFGDAAAGPASLVLDSAGAIWATGGATPSTLPARTDTTLLGGNYIAGLANDGSTLLSLYTAPVGAAGLAIQATPSGIETLGASGTLLLSSTTAAPSLLGLAASPAPAASTTVAPRELISLYGIGIGPTAARNAAITNNVIANSLAGVQVLFDGLPAALLYAGPTQINAIVPAAVAGRETTALSIVTPTGTLIGPTLSVAATLPQVFPTIINQDGTVNSPANPAPKGSIVSIWLTGGGAQTYTPDNLISTGLSVNPYPVSILAIDAQLTPPVPTSLEVLYAGDAPTLPSGVIQVNFMVPTWYAYSYQVQIGNAASAFSLY